MCQQGTALVEPLLGLQHGLQSAVIIVVCAAMRAVTYGLERLNWEVSAWMRGKLQLDGTKPLPPRHVSGENPFMMGVEYTAGGCCFCFLPPIEHIPLAHMGGQGAAVTHLACDAHQKVRRGHVVAPCKAVEFTGMSGRWAAFLLPRAVLLSSFFWAWGGQEHPAPLGGLEGWSGCQCTTHSR